MLRESKPIDYLNDSPRKVLSSVVLPLLLVYLIQIFTTSLSNKLNSLFVGTDYFSINGYLETMLSLFRTLTLGVASSAWILTSRSFAMRDRESIRQHLTATVCAITLVTLSVNAIVLLFPRQILSLLNIPAGIFPKAQTYCLIYCISFFPSALASFSLMVLNGTVSAKRLFFVNLFTVCNSVVLSVLLLVVCKMGLIGAAILPSANALIQLLLHFTLLKKECLFSFQPIRYANWKQIRRIIRYGSLLAMQNLLCSIGYLAVSMQSNKFLSAEYISVLSISLPLSAPLDALSAAITAFCPQNYAAGNKTRLKQFITITSVIGFLYGFFCFILFAVLGRWYFGNLFDNPTIIGYGASFWFWQGIGHPFVSLMYTVRFFMDAVGLGKLTLLSGLGELLGNLICAIWIIPVFGNIGRSISSPLGWFLGSVALLICLFSVRKKIFT